MPGLARLPHTQEESEADERHQAAEHVDQGRSDVVRNPVLHEGEAAAAHQERRPDADFTLMDVISHKYTGKPFPFRNPEGRVALVIEFEKARYTKLPFEHTPAAA